MEARTALAESLAAELDLDMTPEMIAATDRVLIQLFLHGFIVTPIPEDLEEAA